MLQVKKICKQYRTGNLVQKALDGVSLNLRDNEFVAILGPSGSGKTTLLNIIGGLDRYDSGDLIINGISTKKYKDRDWDSYRNHTIGFVFQNYNLIPHQTVLANVELALTISGISKSERRQRAKKALKQVGLGNQGHKKPNQMSGGQMQRVAIARALVNDPDILLADEPTGALDSETSIQVMDLLKEVAKDRLVVMVTHNPDLAKQYATRIVELKDGIICSDSDPYEIEKRSLKTPQHKNMGKASMSLLTSLSLSFNNLKTKKARTILTSFAGSIGIIGIALILSLSNGVNQYIQSIEEDTLSEYPLEIQSTGMDFTSMIDNGAASGDGKKNEGDVQVYSMLTNMFSRVGSNDLASLKKYFDSGKTDIEKYTKSIEYSYNIKPLIYTSKQDEIRKVNPDETFASLGLGSSSSSSSLMSSMMSTDIFYQMPSDTDLYQDQYEIKAGRWPKSYNECVLVLSKSGGVSDFMLYALGLQDYSQLETMISQFSANQKVTIPDNDNNYSFEDLVGLDYKLVNVFDCYQYDASYNVYRDKTDDQNYMREIINNGEDLKIVGVVQPLDGANATMLKSGIGYLSSLTDRVIDQAANSEIVQKQISNPEIDVFTGKRFDEKDESSLDMQSLFSVDSEMLKSAFKIDQSKLSVDASDLDFGNLQIDFSTLPNIDPNSLLSNIDIQFSNEQIASVTDKIKEQFQAYLVEHNLTDPTKMDEYFQAYFQSEEAQALIRSEMLKIIQDSNMVDQFQTNLQNQMQTIMAEYSKTLAATLQQQIATALNKQMSNLANSFQDAISIDTSKFAQAIQINMSEEELSELMLSLMSKETSSYDNNLAKLNYADREKPNAISIYPTDFENKQEVINILDQYNEDVEKVDEDKVITYTDYVGTLMSSVTDIINVISYVLIAFVAISLVVSSIMIGVITYISVLERKKEIGILRAIGASKRNISQVFNAETFIIGLFAGVLGIVITLLLLIPGNMVIHDIAGSQDVSAILPTSGAIILIVLSVILTLLGGLIPAKKAALEDPVTALRTE